MSDSAVKTRPRAEERPTVGRTSRDRTFDRVRWVVTACWICLLGVMPFVSEKTGSWDDVRSAVASGQVTHVRIDHEMPAGRQGSTRVSIHWHDGPLDYVTIVRQIARGDNAEDVGIQYDDEGVTATLHRAPSASLLGLQPSLDITQLQVGTAGEYDHKLLGFVVPGVLTVPVAVLGLAMFLELVGGPQTWRATKWAWFWWFSNPLGIAAFLLFAGPTPGVPAPRQVERRLTGGWSLVLCVLVSSATLSLWGTDLRV